MSVKFSNARLVFIVSNLSISQI